MHRPPVTLFGRNILVVEGEYLTAASLDRELAILGATVTMAGSCLEAMMAVEGQRFDLAVLNLRLPDDMSYEVARALRRLGTPFLFVSDDERPEDEFADVPLMQKRVDRAVLVQRLGALL